jgi:hypothetical protein
MAFYLGTLFRLLSSWGRGVMSREPLGQDRRLSQALRQSNPDAHVVQKSPIVGHVYDDLSSSVALFHIGDCFRHFDERNCPVDDRAHLAPVN